MRHYFRSRHLGKIFTAWHEQLVVHRRLIRRRLNSIHNRYARGRMRKCFTRIQTCVIVSDHQRRCHALQRACDVMQRRARDRLQQRWMTWRAGVVSSAAVSRFVLKVAARRRRYPMAYCFSRLHAHANARVERRSALRVAVLRYRHSIAHARSAVSFAFSVLCAHAHTSNIDVRRARLQVIASRSRSTVIASQVLRRWYTYCVDRKCRRSMFRNSFCAW